MVPLKAFQRPKRIQVVPPNLQFAIICMWKITYNTREHSCVFAIGMCGGAYQQPLRSRKFEFSLMVLIVLNGISWREVENKSISP